MQQNKSVGSLQQNKSVGSSMSDTQIGNKKRQYQKINNILIMDVGIMKTKPKWTMNLYAYISHTRICNTRNYKKMNNIWIMNGIKQKQKQSESWEQKFSLSHEKQTLRA